MFQDDLSTFIDRAGCYYGDTSNRVKPISYMLKAPKWWCPIDTW